MSSLQIVLLVLSSELNLDRGYPRVKYSGQLASEHVIHADDRLRGDYCSRLFSNGKVDVGTTEDVVADRSDEGRIQIKWPIVGSLARNT